MEGGARAPCPKQRRRAGGAEEFSGVAAYYGKNYHGRTAPANNTIRASSPPRTAHCPSAPASGSPTEQRRSVEVVVNDRGPFTRGRVLDLSLAAAKALNMTARGVARVNKPRTKAPLSGAGFGCMRTAPAFVPQDTSMPSKRPAPRLPILEEPN